MAEIKTEQEPSIEEILESIRQIISEDGTPVDAAAAAKPAKPAEAIPAPVPPRPKVQQQIAPAPKPAPPPAPVKAQPILDLTEKVEPVKPESPRIVLEESDEEDNGHLVSDTTADAAVESLARLLANNISVERELPGRPGNVTLEDMTREILRPLLKEWLDSNLQQVIEKMVAREIERLSLRAMDK